MHEVMLTSPVELTTMAVLRQQDMVSPYKETFLEAMEIAVASRLGVYSLITAP
jgi:hypothetical protein